MTIIIKTDDLVLTVSTPQFNISFGLLSVCIYESLFTSSPISSNQVARFRFQNNTSFLVVMPTGTGQDNVSTVAAKLNISDLYARLPSESTMQVKLPKFKLEYKQELQDPLTSIGETGGFYIHNVAQVKL